jgi:hypothetical protein
MESFLANKKGYKPDGGGLPLSLSPSYKSLMLSIETVEKKNTAWD